MLVINTISMLKKCGMKKGQFRIKATGDFHHWYLEIDVLLLPDVFEQFRNMCLKLSY